MTIFSKYSYVEVIKLEVLCLVQTHFSTNRQNPVTRLFKFWNAKSNWKLLFSNWYLRQTFHILGYSSTFHQTTLEYHNANSLMLLSAPVWQTKTKRFRTIAWNFYFIEIVIFLLLKRKMARRFQFLTKSPCLILKLKRSNLG